MKTLVAVDQNCSVTPVTMWQPCPTKAFVPRQIHSCWSAAKPKIGV